VPVKLLIADDSTTIQKVFERTFPPAEFTLSFVNNGEEAWAKVRTERPNVIIADINMPAKNGYELCEDLKKDPALKDIPVLLLIGILDDFDEDESRRVGADGFIIKPFEGNAAISKVREALAKGGSALPAEGPAGEGAEEIMEMADIVAKPAAAPPPQKKGAEDILDLADIFEEAPTTPTPPPLQKGNEDIFELLDVAEQPAAPATPPPKKKKEDEGFLLQTPLRELEEELKAEFPEEKTGLEEELEAELKAGLPEGETEVKEDLSVPLKEEDFGTLELDLPFNDSDLEPQAKDADWTGLFGELGIEEPGQEIKNERLGSILDESTSELEKIERLAKAKDEEVEKQEEEFAEKFMEDFEPVFEPGEDLQHIDTKKDLNIPATEGKEDLAEKVTSAVGHELEEVVEKIIKKKVPELVRQEIDRLKKE